MLRYVEHKRANQREVRLDVTGLDLPTVDEQYLYFNINTYTIANQGKDKRIHTGWESLFSNVNSFFKTLSIDEQTTVAKTLIACNFRISSVMTGDLGGFRELLFELADMVSGLDKELNLYERLQVYAKQTISTVEAKNNGGRLIPQHTAMLTWMEPELDKLYGLSLFCKILSPMFGSLMHYAASVRNCVTVKKASHAYCVISKFLEERAPDILEKMRAYIVNAVTKGFDATTTVTIQGNTKLGMIDHCLAIVTTRSIVNIDLIRAETNIMSYVNIAITSTIKSITSQANKRTICIREDMNANSGEDNQKSFLEIDSITTSKTADTPVIISCAIPRCVDQLIALYSIDRNSYDESIAFYSRNPPHLHDVNRFLVANMFGSYIGGAKGVSLLSCDDFVQLMALAQLILVELDHIYAATIISANVGLTQRAGDRPEDQAIRYNYKNSPNYREYKQYLNSESVRLAVVSEMFENTIEALAGNLATVKYLANLPDHMYGDGGANNNRKELRIPVEIINELCATVLMHK